MPTPARSSSPGGSDVRLYQQKILITGGGSGIGLELAKALAPGNDVVIAGRDVGKLERAKDGLPTLHTRRLDVTSEDEARAAVDWMTNRLGGIDLLINAAGVLKGQAFESAADSAITQEVAVNLLGSVRMTRVALPFLRRSDDGAVVFFSSAVALGASPGLAVYAATKAAVHSLARSLRAELRNEVKVFDVLPPWVDTGLARGLARTRLPAARVVEEVVRALRRDQFEVYIGRIKALGVMGRLAPSIADALLARELIASPGTGSPDERHAPGRNG
ncbi:MAG TPA: SDR family NAD(P)-dependent oxidoreductase [Candidatus Acidoferrales bacterium]|nr:SDR family NAD(P)-dependent oxidoreductase [Candidatus Acidoferrales bacterium]